MEMRGQSAIVTGAGQGIGEATALCLGREGAQVILFLACSRASAVTGVTYPVDGGMMTAQSTWQAS
jgi:NAD(P)-dependent dehydrogenase (short-subunit alcohol dehydrogenase family)